MEKLTALEAELAAAQDDAARLLALNRLAAAVARVGDLERALGMTVQAGALARQLGSVREIGRADHVRATCEYLRADYVGAHQRSLDSCAVAERCDDRDGLAAALLLAAACQYQMGALEQAYTVLLQVLDFVAEKPDDELSFRAHNMLGMILVSRDDYSPAQNHFELAIAAGTRMGSAYYLQRARVNRASLLCKIGLALRVEGKEADALARFEVAAADCEAIRVDNQHQATRENAAGCAGVLGEIYMQLGRTDQALALFDEMLQHGVALGNLLLQAEALLQIGRHHSSCRNDQLARDCLQSALELATRASARRLVVDVTAALAQASEACGKLREAIEYYKSRQRLSEDLVRAELAAATRARNVWLDYQRTRREATLYKERFDALVHDHDALELRSTGLSRAALEDALTGLSNRRHLDALLTELTGSARDSDTRTVVAIMDIDLFKQINDRHSHGVGDDVLRCVATMIRTHCREGDVSARYGGDEFVVCLRGTTLEAAQGVMERLRRRVQANDWDAKCPGLAVTITVGLTQVRPDDDAVSVLARADAVLYRSKEGGRNQVGVD